MLMWHPHWALVAIQLWVGTATAGTGWRFLLLLLLMALIKITNTVTVQASCTLWTILVTPSKSSNICSKQSLSRGRLQMTDVTRMAGDRRNLKKDQWLAECSPLMSKSANQIHKMKLKNKKSSITVWAQNFKKRKKEKLIPWIKIIYSWRCN